MTSPILPKALVPATPVGNTFASQVTVSSPRPTVDALPDTPCIAKPAATTEFNADVPTTPVSVTLASPVTFASLPNLLYPNQLPFKSLCYSYNSV